MISIKEVSDILKTKCGQSCFTFICLDSDWTLSNGSLDLELFHLDNVQLVEIGNLKLAESILSLIRDFDNVKHDNHIQFSLSFPTFSKSSSSCM